MCERDTHGEVRRHVGTYWQASSSRVFPYSSLESVVVCERVSDGVSDGVSE